MKKLRLSLFAMSAATLLFAASSCKKDRGEAVGPVSGGESFTAVAECQAGDAKTGLQGLDVLWSEGDEIVVFDAENHRGLFVLGEGTGTASGKFTKVKNIDGNDETHAFNMGSSPFRAFYPAKVGDGADDYVSYNGETQTYTVRVPEVQEYASKGFSKNVNPMAAYSTTTSLQFHNLCGVLKLTVKGVNAVHRVLVKGNNGESEPVCGVGAVKFNDINRPVLDMAGGTWNDTVVLSCGAVRLNREEGVDFYIVLPENGFPQGFTVGMDFGREVVKKVAPMSSEVVNSIRVGRIREMPAFDVKSYPSAEDVPDDTFVGSNPDAMFTVSSGGEQVYFSKGNLQYRPKDAKWRFAENQWDTLMGHDGSVADVYRADYNGWIDMFGWGTSGNAHRNAYYMPYEVEEGATAYTAYNDPNKNLYDGNGVADWGYNAISNGGNVKQCWRTLTSIEWNHLLFNRTSVNHKYLKVKVVPKPAVTPGGGEGAKGLPDSIVGLLVFPDGFNKWEFLPNDAPYDIKDNDFSTVVESSKMQPGTPVGGGAKDETEGVFEQLEREGCVFLPCAGYRFNTDVNDVEASGLYWSSTLHSPDNAYYLLFYPSSVMPMHNNPRSHGFSVRLVCPRR